MFLFHLVAVRNTVSKRKLKRKWFTVLDFAVTAHHWGMPEQKLKAEIREEWCLLACSQAPGWSCFHTLRPTVGWILPHPLVIKTISHRHDHRAQKSNQGIGRYEATISHSLLNPNPEVVILPSGLWSISLKLLKYRFRVRRKTFRLMMINTLSFWLSDYLFNGIGNLDPRDLLVEYMMKLGKVYKRNSHDSQQSYTIQWHTCH